jgi:transcriptional regulator with XRE-family HTH domain
MEGTNSLGERIKMVRERAELSQKEFGKKVELSQTAVTALENNQNEPRLSTFNNIVEAFKVNPEWLRTGVGEIKAAPLMHINQDGNDSERIQQLERELERERAWTEKLYEENKQFRALGKTQASTEAADTPVIPLWGGVAA